MGLTTWSISAAALTVLCAVALALAPAATTGTVPYISSYAYTGCGTADANSRPDPSGTPCPGGGLDVAANAWTADDFIAVGPDGKERPWQTLMFAAQGNLTYFAQTHAEVARRTGVRLPVLWQWNAWRTLPGPAGARVPPGTLDASVTNFSVAYGVLSRQFAELPPTPWGVFLGDEPPYPLVTSRLADAAAAVKRRWPNAVTHVNLDYETITNASVPPILGAATGLDWIGSDLYYSDPTHGVNASVATFRGAYATIVYPHLRPDQRVALVPFAHYCEFYCPIGALPLAQADAYTLGVAEDYTRWAAEDPKVAVVLLYLLKMVWNPAGADVCENPPCVTFFGGCVRLS